MTVANENVDFKASLDDDDYNSEDENIDVDALTYPDILWRGEFQPRSEDGQEEEQEHISSNGSVKFNQICPFLVFTAGCFFGCFCERSGRPTTTTTSETTTAASGANNRGG